MKTQPLPSYMLLLILTTIAARFPSSNAFAPSVKPINRPTALSASLPEVVDATRVKKLERRRYNVIEARDPNALTFSGQIVKTSRSLVSIEDKDLLIDFFKSPKARDTLFVSDAPPIPVNPVPVQLFREWQLETKRFGIAIPQKDESHQQTVMQLCSKGISFSGLTVETTVNCGAKLIDENPDTGLPAYEFTMINDRTDARGPRPLLWIYNQVMSFVSKRSSNNQKTTTSLCRIALVETKAGIAVDFESSFQVKMSFPSFLMKVLPISKSKAEEQGSSAVMKFVQKGVEDSLQRFEQTFQNSMRLRP